MARQRLTKEQVQEIKTEGARRIDAGETSYAKLGHEYGVAATTIRWHIKGFPPSKLKGKKSTRPYVFKKRTKLVSPMETLVVPPDTGTRAALIYGTPEQLASFLRGMS